MPLVSSLTLTHDSLHVCVSVQIKDDVESTELALAFQLSVSSSCDVKPQKQPVFAFLPLRSFGFRFIIQGSFDTCITVIRLPDVVTFIACHIRVIILKPQEKKTKSMFKQTK